MARPPAGGRSAARVEPIPLAATGPTTLVMGAAFPGVRFAARSFTVFRLPTGRTVLRGTKLPVLRPAAAPAPTPEPPAAPAPSPEPPKAASDLCTLSGDESEPVAPSTPQAASPPRAKRPRISEPDAAPPDAAPPTVGCEAPDEALLWLQESVDEMLGPLAMRGLDGIFDPRVGTLLNW